MPPLHSSPPTGASPRARMVTALVTLYLVWSSTYLALRYVVAALPPMLTGALRFALAGLTLFAVQRLRGEPGPARRDWSAAAASGALLFTAANGMLCVAETRVPSSVAAVACATTPLFVVALGALRGERPRAGELAGVVLGIAGVLVLGLGEFVSAAGPRGMLLLLSPLAWAWGTVVARRARPVSTVTFAAQQMVCGAATNLALGVALGERVPSRVPEAAAWGFAWLVVFGSVVAFPAYAYLVRNARPAVATSYAYVNPVLAVVLGAAMGGERLTGSTLLALALVFVAVLAVRPTRADRPATPTAEPRGRGSVRAALERGRQRHGIRQLQP
jgi:drug/metabolite transporter (DMT)-like permease